MMVKFWIHFSAAFSCQEVLTIAGQKLPDGEYLLAHEKVSKLKKVIAMKLIFIDRKNINYAP